MIAEDHGCEVVCRFCNTTYQYDEGTLQGYVNAQTAYEKKQTEVAGKA